MKRVLLPLFVLSFLPAFVHAGKTSFSGSATVSAPAEFVSVNITVKSECFGTRSEARLANDAAVKQIQAYLKTLIDTSNGVDKIICNGGYTTAFSRTIYEGHESRTVCRNTFQKTTDITFKTKNVEAFSEMFSNMQDKVLAEFGKGDEASVDAMTYAEMGSPNADICDHTRKMLAMKALNDATINAQERFKTFADCCGIDLSQSATVAGGEENNRVTYNKSRYMESEPSSDLPVVETSFDAINVSANVTVEWIHPDAEFSQCAYMRGMASSSK